MVRKVIGGKASDLISFFAARDPAVFSTAEAADFLRSTPEGTYPILSRLVRQGWLSRTSRGIYEVAPPWATHEQPYIPDRYAALASLLARSPENYVGFFSAFELHGLLSNPPAGRMWVAVPASRSPIRVAGNRVVWVVVSRARFDWGIEKRWMETRSFKMSDLERTILDGLHLPRHVGGVAIVAGALHRAQSRIDPTRLANHARTLGIDAVRRRLGYLVENVLPPGSPLARAWARKIRPREVSGRATLLDPGLPPSGAVDPRWRIRANVPLADLLAETTS